MNSALQATGFLFKRYPKLQKISRAQDEKTTKSSNLIDNINNKAAAIKELKEAKEMLDLGILSKEEYDKIVEDRPGY